MEVADVTQPFDYISTGLDSKMGPHLPSEPCFLGHCLHFAPRIGQFRGFTVDI